ncbi:VC0807 family protein [Streptomyces hyaluromycini]|uniref:VC0807 family protein n=1 Tax=Streptomyces hyaluromycini TaxID=1377993 RepID=UPI000B5C94E5|nr:VC0807 family protein [Streptomyces hyaluromycini]
MTKTTNTGSRNNDEGKQQQPSVLENFKPLIVDVAVPLGSYYLFKGAFGMSTFAALAWSSVVPAARTVWSVVKERRGNAFAGLILLVNVVSLALSFVSGDPRLMLAKDSGVSSAIGIAILVSVVMGRPMMTEGLKPFVVKGDAAREAAFERLRFGSAAFRRAERVYSLVWGVLLLTECVVRVVGAYTLPVDTMVWLGTVILVGAIGIGMVVSGGLAAEPMARMISAEVTAAEEATEETAEDVEDGARREAAVAA